MGASRVRGDDLARIERRLMIDINKIAMLVAQLPLQDAERSAMLKLIPRMRVHQLRELLKYLEAEARAWTGLEA